MNKEHSGFLSGSLRDARNARKKKKEEEQKQAKLLSEQELKAKMDQINSTLITLRAHELRMKNKVELQRREALAVRSNPAQKARFVRELRKLEYDYIYLWRTQELEDALETKQMEVQMALDTKNAQEAFTLAGKLSQETMVDLDKMLGKAEMIGMSQNAAAIDKLFDSYVQKRGGENPFSDEYIDMLLSGEVTEADLLSSQVQPVAVHPDLVKPQTEHISANEAATAEDRFRVLENLLGNPSD